MFKQNSYRCWISAKSVNSEYFLLIYTITEVPIGMHQPIELVLKDSKVLKLLKRFFKNSSSLFFLWIKNFLTLHHVNKKSSKNCKFSNYKIRDKLFDSRFSYCFCSWCHIRPKLPKVKPIPQKKANSARSLHPDGIEFKATLIRWAILPCTRRWWKKILRI